MTPFRLGLTGSIGMGKSTTAAMFASSGVSVWDADAVVRALYAPGMAAMKLVGQHYPVAVVDGAVSRAKLRDLIRQSPQVLDHLERLVHPLVAENRHNFIAASKSDIVLLDIPLLFETGADKDCDAVVVVSAPPEVQRARVLARGEMSAEDLHLILSRQMPDAEKRARATWVIDTRELAPARVAVKRILADIRKRTQDA
jgi:dephospho-CoA kinase